MGRLFILFVISIPLLSMYLYYITQSYFYTLLGEVLYILIAMGLYNLIDTHTFCGCRKI